MRTTKIYAIGHWSLVIGIAMLLLADNAWAVDFKNTYQGMEQKTSAMEYKVATTATAPSAYFQSTSVYSGQWNQDAQQSMLNADGTVNAGAYGIGNNNVSGGPRRDPAAPNPEVDEKDDDGNTPLGDAALPLLLLACAYALYKVRNWNEAVSQ